MRLRDGWGKLQGAGSSPPAPVMGAGRQQQGSSLGSVRVGGLEQLPFPLGSATSLLLCVCWLEVGGWGSSGFWGPFPLPCLPAGRGGSLKSGLLSGLESLLSHQWGGGAFLQPVSLRAWSYQGPGKEEVICVRPRPLPCPSLSEKSWRWGWAACPAGCIRKPCARRARDPRGAVPSPAPTCFPPPPACLWETEPGLALGK